MPPFCRRLLSRALERRITRWFDILASANPMLYVWSITLDYAFGFPLGRNPPSSELWSAAKASRFIPGQLNEALGFVVQKIDFNYISLLSFFPAPTNQVGVLISYFISLQGDVVFEKVVKSMAPMNIPKEEKAKIFSKSARRILSLS